MTVPQNPTIVDYMHQVDVWALDAEAPCRCNSEPYPTSAEFPCAPCWARRITKRIAVAIGAGGL